MTAQKQVLTIVVNGVPTEIERNVNAPLKSTIEKALEQTGNTGRPLDDWELRDIQGNVLDLGRKIGDYQFPADVKLFLNLKAGIGG